MWDLDTIKHLNESVDKNDPRGRRMTKLWKYMDAWRKSALRKKNLSNKPKK